MRFNATYLVKTDEERASLEQALEVLGKQTEPTAIGKDALDVFCAYTTYTSIGDKKTVMVVPRERSLPGLKHTSAHFTAGTMSVTHPHSEFYRLSLGCPSIDFDIYYEPIQDFGKYFPRDKEEGR